MGIITTIVAFLIHKQDMVCSVPLGNQGQPWLHKKAELRSLRLFSSPQSLAGSHRLLADLVLTSGLGLHLVYTWSTLGLQKTNVLVAKYTVYEYQAANNREQRILLLVLLMFELRSIT